MSQTQTDTVVIGASAAGLATSACLKRAGVEHVLLERAAEVGSAWRSHYDRLHLHTTKGLSTLPFVPWPKKVSRYPSRIEVVEYLENYVRTLELQPRCNTEVTSVRREKGEFRIETSETVYLSKNVVFATGYTRVPYSPAWPGIENFKGELLHSGRYSNGTKWQGHRVLVVGFGNSAGEIAIDLHEHGAFPALSVRGPVNVVPRDIIGLPILGVGIAMSVFPPGVADVLGASMVRASVGNIEKLGLKKLPYGPNTQVRKHGRIPLLDIGTISLIRSGDIAVKPGIERFHETGVSFVDGETENYRAIVLATGYRPRVSDMLQDSEDTCSADGTPLSSGREAAPGLYYCGFYVSPTGMLRAIAQEARDIASSITKRLAK